MKKERMNKMNEPQIFKNDLFEVAVATEDRELLFDVETVARSLGISDLAKQQNERRKAWMEWQKEHCC